MKPPFLTRRRTDSESMLACRGVHVVARAGGGGRRGGTNGGRGQQQRGGGAPEWARPPNEGRQRKSGGRGKPPVKKRTTQDDADAGANERRSSSRTATSVNDSGFGSGDKQVRASKALTTVDADGVAALKDFKDAGRGTKTLTEGEQRRVSAEEALQYERNGHVCIRGAVSPPTDMNPMVKAVSGEIMARRLEAYKHRVSVLCPGVGAEAVTSVEEARKILKKHSKEDVGFLQTFNLHRDEDSPATEYIMSKRFAKIAAELMGCKKVRLYQSCVFVKEPGMAETNWHSDLNMVPLDTNDFITLWIPLRSLDEGDAALHFASKSHRDFSLPYWHTLQGMEDLEGRYEIDTYDELDLGDLTAHNGWTLHWSPPQPKDAVPRYALSICYVADGARRLSARNLRRAPHEEDLWSYEGWLKDIEPGAVAKHPELPRVWP